MSSLRSMAVLSSRAHERRSREKKKNRLPGFVAFSTAVPFNSFWNPVDNLFGFSFPSQSEIKSRAGRAAKPRENEKPPARIRGIFNCRPLQLILISCWQLVWFQFSQAIGNKVLTAQTRHKSSWYNVKHDLGRNWSLLEQTQVFSLLLSRA